MKARFEIVLEDLGCESAPAVVRLRQALKRLGRTWDFKCIELKEAKQESEETANES